MTIPQSIYKTVIFDFDGTLADTLPKILEIANQLADVYGYRQVQPGEIQDYRNKTTRQAIRDLHLPVLLIPQIAFRVKKALQKEIHLTQPIQGIDNLLHELRQRGYRLGILTSNSKENVNAFLQNHGWHSLFDFVHSESNIFGKSRVIKKLLKQHSLIAEEVVYIGDETRDIEASQKTGISVIAVNWGINSEKTLAAFHPTFQASHPAELLQILT